MSQSRLVISPAMVGAMGLLAACTPPPAKPVPSQATASVTQQLPPGRVYVFHSAPHGACPELDWHVVLESNDVLTGMISWDNQQHVARASGTLNRQARTFSMTAQEVGGRGRTANVSGTVRQDGWLIANIEGPTVSCLNIDVPWFVPPPPSA